MPGVLSELLSRWRANPAPEATIALCEHLAGVGEASPDGEEFARYFALVEEVGRAAAAAHAGRVDVLVAVGRMYLAADDLAAAQSVLMTAAAQAPDHARAARLLGEVLLRRGDARRALIALDRALAQGASDRAARALRERARVLAEQFGLGAPGDERDAAQLFTAPPAEKPARGIPAPGGRKRRVASPTLTGLGAVEASSGAPVRASEAPRRSVTHLGIGIAPASSSAGPAAASDAPRPAEGEAGAHAPRERRAATLVGLSGTAPPPADSSPSQAPPAGTHGVARAGASASLGRSGGKPDRPTFPPSSGWTQEDDAAIEELLGLLAKPPAAASRSKPQAKEPAVERRAGPPAESASAPGRPAPNASPANAEAFPRATIRFGAPPVARPSIRIAPPIAREEPDEPPVHAAPVEERDATRAEATASRAPDRPLVAAAPASNQGRREAGAPDAPVAIRAPDAAETEAMAEAPGGARAAAASAEAPSARTTSSSKTAPDGETQASYEARASAPPVDEATHPATRASAPKEAKRPAAPQAPARPEASGSDAEPRHGSSMSVRYGPARPEASGSDAELGPSVDVPAVSQASASKQAERPFTAQAPDRPEASGSNAERGLPIDVPAASSDPSSAYLVGERAADRDEPRERPPPCALRHVAASSPPPSSPEPSPAGAATPAAAARRSNRRRIATTVLVGAIAIEAVVALGSAYRRRLRDEQARAAQEMVQIAAASIQRGGGESLDEAASTVARARELAPSNAVVAIVALKVRTYRLLEGDDTDASALAAAEADARAAGAAPGETAFARVAAAAAKGDAAAAERAIEEADRDPARANDAWYQLAAGAFLEARGDERAIERYGRAAEADAEFVAAHVRLARAMLLYGPKGAGRPFVVSFVQRFPHRPETRVLQALIGALDPSGPSAAPALSSVVPDDLPRSLRAIGRLLTTPRDAGFTAAIDEADVPHVAVLCGRHALVAGDTAAGRRAAERALRMAPAFAPAASLFIESALRSGKAGEAAAASAVPGPVGETVRALLAYETGDVAALRALAGDRTTGFAAAALERWTSPKPLSRDRLAELRAHDAPWADLLAVDAALDRGDLAEVREAVERWPDAASHPLRALRLARLLRYQGNHASARAALEAAAPSRLARIEAALVAAQSNAGIDAALAALDGAAGPEQPFVRAYALARKRKLAAAKAILRPLEIPKHDAPVSVRTAAALAFAVTQDQARAGFVKALAKAWPKNPDIVRAAVSLGFLPASALRKLQKP